MASAITVPTQESEKSEQNQIYSRMAVLANLKILTDRGTQVPISSGLAQIGVAISTRYRLGWLST